MFLFMRKTDKQTQASLFLQTLMQYGIDPNLSNVYKALEA